MADAGSSISRIVTSSTSFVEKAVEFRHFMLFTYFVFLLDSCLILFYKKPLLSAFSGLNAPEVSAANAIVFMGVFFFSMALFFPTLRQITRMCVAWIYFKWFYKFPTTNSAASGWHYPSLIKEKALLNKDKFVLDLIDKHEEETNSKNINFNVGFSLAIISAINYFTLGDKSLNTITQQAVLLLDANFGFIINQIVKMVIFVFVIFNLIMLYLSLNPIEEDKIYLPDSEEANRK